jgi:hypothetical protein
VPINDGASVANDQPPKRAGDVKVRALQEGKKFLVMFAYLWLVLALFVMHESIVLAQYDIDFTGYGLAFFNALLLAKVMLLAEDLHIARSFEAKPPIYAILYNSVVFAILFMTFKAVEEILVGLWRGQSVLESIPSYGGGSLKGIVSVGLITTVALIPFFAFREIGRAVGADELRALVLARRPKVNTAVSVRHPRS